eukprot:TRINITY_DN26545_c1_g2_i1.p3 TRINITY_DN26545_c1_g2~~TRINITY_DN26545_c1_g2_i1.p3  ORF type:complete len:108 (+),score=6.96 TRINITY_DN26545_c1_g2_i1:446-769(+)
MIRESSITPSEFEHMACWEYIDPKQKTQGLFTMSEMKIWSDHGYFKDSLPVRCCRGDPFLEIKRLYPVREQRFCNWPQGRHTGVHRANTPNQHNINIQEALQMHDQR